MLCVKEMWESKIIKFETKFNSFYDDSELFIVALTI